MSAAHENGQRKSYDAGSGEILINLGITLLGVGFLAGAQAIAVLPSYAFIGPRFFPYLVGFGLLACGLALLITRDGANRHRIARQSGTRGWTGVCWIGGGMILTVALIQTAGYIVTATLLFVAVARGLDGSRWLVSVGAGLALSIATYLAFTRLLDLHLPAGWLQFMGG